MNSIDREGQIKHFRFWCQKVLPLVYEDSLSYYEVLCKVSDALNELITQVNLNTDDIESLQSAVTAIQNELKAIKEGDYLWLQQIIENAMKNIYPGINSQGQLVIYIPQSWSDVKFNTTGLDIVIPLHPEYGRLVVSY